MHVRKPTYSGRITVDQQARLVIDAEEGADDGTYREVQLIVPDSPLVLMAIDHPTPLEAGPNRAAYKFTPLAAGTQIVFNLQPQQKVYLVAQSGQAFPGVIIQYLEG